MTAARRRLFFVLLYLSEGAPVGYLWWALPTRLRNEGVAIDEVTALTAMLTVPWSIKFLWAPLVDVFSSERFGSRAWILASQAVMGLSLLPLMVLDAKSQLGWLTVALLAHSVCAATQDVAIDALAVRSVPVRERGAITGWMQVGMLVGRSLFGGVALVVEPWLGARGVVLALVGTVWLSGTVALFVVAPADDARPSRPERNVAALAWRVLSRPATLLGFGLAALAGAAMDGTGAVAGPLLIDLGVNQADVGRFFAIPAVLGMAVGALGAGRASDRFGRCYVATRAIAATALCVSLLAVLLWRLPPAGSVTSVAIVLSVAYLLFGALTGATYAVLMDLTEPRLAALQFSAYMGAVNFCYVWSSWLVGQVSAAFDYSTALVTVAGASVVALALLARLRKSGLLLERAVVRG
jgi:MFS family permease